MKDYTKVSMIVQISIFLCFYVCKLNMLSLMMILNSTYMF